MSTIFDAITRQQIYLEMLKYGASSLYVPTSTQIKPLIAGALAALKVTKLSDLTKLNYNLFLRDLIQRVKKLMLQFQADLSAWLRKLLHVQTTMTRQICEEYTTEAPDPARRRLLVWANINNLIVPAFGVTLAVMLANFASGTTAQITKQINISYANNAELKDLDLSRVIDNAERQASSIINTGTQHVAIQTQQSVETLFYGYYRYIAVLDERTTDICRSLNEQVFEFGKGPVPPQHINCRSTIIPVESPTDKVPEFDFSDWIDNQSADFLKDVGASAKSTNYKATRGITLDEFAGKLQQILDS